MVFLQLFYPRFYPKNSFKKWLTGFIVIPFHYCYKGKNIIPEDRFMSKWMALSKFFILLFSKVGRQMDKLLAGCLSNFISINTLIGLSIWIYRSVYVRVCARVYACMCVCVCMYTCMCVCVYVCSWPPFVC